MYKLLYHPRCIKFLQKLPKRETDKILLKIGQLKKDPLSSELDIKKLATTKRSYRLRIGNIRVIYEVENKGKVIYIHEIDFRGNIY